MSLRPRLSLAASLCLVLAACTSAPTEELDLAGIKQDAGSRCTPGETQDCICLGGGQGIQTCRASGSSFGSCTGCGGDLPDGIIVVSDMGSSPCGTCDGCCDGTTCVPFASETTSRCGPLGQACAACPGSKVCSTSSGSCVDPGGGCMSCPYGVTCAGGSCTNMIDTNAYFKVNVKSAKVLVNTTNCKNNWDYFGDPNVYVCVGYQSGGTLYQGCNQGANTASLDVTWTGADQLMTSGGQPFLVPASIFVGGKMQISMYDDDYPDSDDLMAEGFYPGKTTLDASYSTGMFGCATNITFTLSQ